jgi:hypothetical protein
MVYFIIFLGWLMVMFWREIVNYFKFIISRFRPKVTPTMTTGRYPRKTDKEGNVKCPNCKGKEWTEGPSGGCSVNIRCNKCHKEYNDMGPFGLESIERNKKL